ncbi:MAG: glycosyltransferase family 39 protein [Candidatus Margulisbacteria bacterium]|jgi:4-amino-4-deoxy-L-arabinose transferase-like glycosyltransferase|nr:glycosyltransferase family 39 protein [Candidatus Margulisiibacteriota bacterium]
MISKIRWICLLNLALCLFTLFVLTDPLYVINHEATQIAAHLVRGEGFTGSGGLQIRNAPSAIIQPLYPALLAVMLWLFKVPGAFLALRLLQSVLSVLLCRLIYLIARELVPENTALLAALFYAVYFPFIYTTTIIWDTMLFSLLVAAAVYLTLKYDGRRRRWPLLLGLTLGLLGLTNAVGLIIVPIILGWLWLKYKEGGYRTVLKLGLVLGLTVILIAPWSIRNIMLFKAFVPVRTGFWGILYLVNNEDATGTMLLLHQGKRTRDVNEGVTLHYRPLIGELADLNEEQQEQYFKRKFLSYVAAHPVRFGKMLAVKMYYYLWINPYDPVQPAWLLQYFLLLLLGVIGGYWAVKERRDFSLFFWLFGAFLLVYTVMGPLYNWKYRLPVEPYLIILAAYGLSTVIPAVRSMIREARLSLTRP